MSQVAEGADTGVEGNGRLTGTVGLVLLVLLFAEGVTILSIRGLITVHVFLGLILVPPVVLKIAATTYRFARYYTHAAPYVRRGPPLALLRLIGPVLIAVTVLLLASGVWLLVIGPDGSGLVLTVHKGSFVVWFALMAVHVLAHVRETFSLAGRDWRRAASLRADQRPADQRPADRGRGLRAGAVALALVAGVALGAVVTPTAGAWADRGEQSEGR